LMQTILFSKSDIQEMQAVKFLLSLGEQFKNFKSTPELFESWHIAVLIY